MTFGKYITTGIIILLLQLLACEFLSVWPPLYIALLPLLIILLPEEVNPYGLMLLAFGAGLLVDALSDGILGLNATACTSVAFFKKILLSWVIRYESQIPGNNIGSRTIGGAKFFALLTMAYAVFFIPYVLLDGFGTGDVLFLLMRIALNIIVNTLAAYALERIFNYRVLRNG